MVVGIEHIPALTALAEKNIRADGLGRAIDERGILLVTGDGRLGALSTFRAVNFIYLFDFDFARFNYLCDAATRLLYMLCARVR